MFIDDSSVLGEGSLPWHPGISLVEIVGSCYVDEVDSVLFKVSLNECLKCDLAKMDESSHC